MVKFGPHSATKFQIVSSQILMGIGSAVAVALVETTLQAAHPQAMHTQISASLAIFAGVGFAAGAALAGDIWTRLLPTFLMRELMSTGHARDLPSVLADPLTFIESYPIGTSTRTGIISAYTSTWRLLITVAIVIAGASFLAIFAINGSSRSEDGDAPVKMSASKRGSLGSLESVTESSEHDDKPYYSASRRSSVRATPPLIPMQVAAASVSPLNTPREARSRANSGASVAESLSGSGLLRSFGPLRRHVRASTEDEDETIDAGMAQLPRFGTPAPRSPGRDGLLSPTSSPAPILVVDEAPFEPPSCPPTPPGFRAASALRPLSPLHQRQQQ